MISQRGGLCATWPNERITAKITVDCLLAHWRDVGLPRSAKFDNGTVIYVRETNAKAQALMRGHTFESDLGFLIAGR